MPFYLRWSQRCSQKHKMVLIDFISGNPVIFYLSKQKHWNRCLCEENACLQISTELGKDGGWVNDGNESNGWPRLYYKFKTITNNKKILFLSCNEITKSRPVAVDQVRLWPGLLITDALNREIITLTRKPHPRQQTADIRPASVDITLDRSRWRALGN